MKKLFVLPAIALALVGLLVFVACPTDPDTGTDVKTSELETAIKEAYAAQYGVEEANNVSEVATGVSWVTKAVMDTFNEAIKNAETTRDKRSSQSSVDTAKTNLRAAIIFFNAAKLLGTANAITLRGTITVKNNGQTVPYVEIIAHDIDWSWSKATRLSSSSTNTPWSITMTPFDVPTSISFRIEGFADDKYDSALINFDYKDTIDVYEDNINDIFISLANLRTLTLSGTISAGYDGKPVPSVAIQASSKDNNIVLGEAIVKSVRNNTSWSMMIPFLDTDTEIMFAIWFFDGPGGWNDNQIYSHWGYEPVSGVTVKNQDKSGIKIDLANIKIITLSGTINVTYNGQPVPYVKIMAWKLDGTDNYWGNWLGQTIIGSPGSNVPWSFAIESFDKNTDVWFSVNGYENAAQLDADVPFFEWGWDWSPDDMVLKVKKTVKDQSISNIVLNIGNIENITLSGTINVTYDGQPVPYVVIQAYAYDEYGAYTYLGDVSISPTGNNTLWTIYFDAFDKDTVVLFDIIGFPNSNSSWEDRLFVQWYDPGVLVKDQNKSGIVLNLGDMGYGPVYISDITLSGTINVRYDGQPVPYVQIAAYAYDVYGEYPYSYLGGTVVTPVGNSTTWSMTIETLSKDTVVLFDIIGYPNSNFSWDDRLFYREDYNPGITIKDQNKSGIVLNLGDMYPGPVARSLRNKAW